MIDQEEKERREYERFPFREDIMLDGTKLCSSMDISEGGLYLSTIQTFEKNSVIDVSIPFKGKNLMVKARVQYIQPGIGIGIMFVNLTDEQKTQIKELIASIPK